MAGKIFLSYRREDAAGFALALFGRLEQSFPAGSLFMDVEGGIGAGQDFVRVIEEQVNACDVMLALIGPDWLAVTDEAGRPRLENPEDFVRIEVESALKFGKRVIPVLVQKAEMPRARALPETLRALARRNAVGLTQERFKAGAQGLIKALEDALAEVEEARARAATETAAAAVETRGGTGGQGRWGCACGKGAGEAQRHRRPVAEQIVKAEELANWDFIKASDSIQDFRDHLARFPQGVTLRMARSRLEALVWAGLPRPADPDVLKGFIAEFANGARASEANAMLAELEAQTALRSKRLNARRARWTPGRRPARLGPRPLSKIFDEIGLEANTATQRASGSEKSTARRRGDDCFRGSASGLAWRRLEV
jgi:hypothetical protein